MDKLAARKAAAAAAELEAAAAATKKTKKALLGGYFARLCFQNLSAASLACYWCGHVSSPLLPINSFHYNVELCNVGPSRHIYNARHVAIVISLVTTITRYNVLLHSNSDILPTSLLSARYRAQDTAAASVAYQCIP
eukprot:8290-Heterococcus_DN1.PRE.1